jgi:thioredoxin-like negative regulator of GroEL
MTSKQRLKTRWQIGLMLSIGMLLVIWVSRFNQATLPVLTDRPLVAFAHAEKSPKAVSTINQLPLTLSLEKTVAMSPTLLVFHSEQCGACRAFEPKVKQFKQTYQDKLNVLNIDVYHHPEADALNQLYKVTVIPSVYLYNKRNKLVYQQQGNGTDALEKALKQQAK